MIRKKSKKNMAALLDNLSDNALESLKKQMKEFDEDLEKYCK